MPFTVRIHLDCEERLNESNLKWHSMAQETLLTMTKFIIYDKFFYYDVAGLGTPMESILWILRSVSDVRIMLYVEQYDWLFDQSRASYDVDISIGRKTDYEIALRFTRFYYMSCSVQSKEAKVRYALLATKTPITYQFTSHTWRHILLKSTIITHTHTHTSTSLDIHLCYL